MKDKRSRAELEAEIAYHARSIFDELVRLFRIRQLAEWLNARLERWKWLQ